MRRIAALVSAVSAAVVLAACSSPPAPPEPDLAAPPDLAAGPDLSSPPDLAPAGCPRTPAPADRARKLVLSLPYDEAGMKAARWTILDLSADGKLSKTDASFTMGRATTGEIAFTPDGDVGLVAQEDGTVGVFRLGGGKPQVVHAAFKGAFYADSVIMDPSGERAYVLDAQWRENGGGIYSVRIGCDGNLEEEGRLVEARLPRGLALLPEGRALVAAEDALDSRAGDTAHLLRLQPAPSVVGGADAFGDDKALVSALAVMPDGKFALVGDNNEFSGIDNRVSAVAILPDGLRRAQVLTPINDPVSIVPSPFGNAALVVSGYGNALFVLSYVADAPMGPFALRGEVTYNGKRPQLPDGAVVITRGQLRGKVLVAENLGVRQVRFLEGGGVVDDGLFPFGAGLSSIVGAIGVQP